MKTTTKQTASKPKKGSGRGFASMSEEKRRQIASEGGRAAHRYGTAHEWTSDEAREAGRNGGRKRAENSRKENTLSQDS